ncbi:AI-2E family transporter [Sphingomonas sp. R86521]|uniref:AI-2E family transporter n=1 Tax=Sphingomonas sp. R86521 TaxID=3093860 RepID=UPI0036D2ACEA
MHATTTLAQVRARVALAAVVALAALWIGSAFVPAILWAGVVGIAVEPLRLRMLRRWPGHDMLIAGLITLAVVAIVVVPLVIAVTRALIEVEGITHWINDARAHGVPVAAWVANLPVGSTQVSAWWTNHLATPEGAAEQIARLDMGTIIEKSKSVGHNIVERAVVFAFTVLMLFFIVRDHDAISAQLSRAIDRAFGDAGIRIGRQINLSVRGTVDGVVLLGLAQGVVMAVIYAFAGVPHPILLGLLSGVGAMVPFGLIAVMLIALALLVIQGAIVTAMVVGVVGGVMSFVVDHTAKPALIGGATKLPFVWVLIGIIGGVETIGLLGLFVGPAVMAALVLIWREWVAGDAVGMASGTSAAISHLGQ